MPVEFLLRCPQGCDSSRHRAGIERAYVGHPPLRVVTPPAVRREGER